MLEAEPDWIGRASHPVVEKRETGEQSSEARVRGPGLEPSHASDKGKHRGQRSVALVLDQVLEARVVFKPGPENFGPVNKFARTQAGMDQGPLLRIAVVGIGRHAGIVTNVIDINWSRRVYEFLILPTVGGDPLAGLAFQTLSP